MANEIITKLHEKIAAQQGPEGTAVWCVGEDLKEIVGNDRRLAEIVLTDLDAKGMSLADCEHQIKAKADERHKKTRGTGVGVSPKEAEEIIRQFYGLGEAAERETPAADDVVDLASFF